MAELIVGVSPLNVPMAEAGVRGAGWYMNILPELGADGWLWSQFPTVHPGNLARGGVGQVLARQGKLLGLHQSWRATRWPDVIARSREAASQAVGPLQAARAAASMALQEGVLLTLPHYDNSLDRLAPIQAASKQGTHPLGLPVIVHPQAQMLGNLQVKAPNYREYRRRFPAGIHYQLTPELLPAWGINTQEPEGIADGLAEAQHRFGLDDPVLDSMWFFATRGGQQFEDPFGLARALSRRGKVAGLQINWNADNSADPEQTTENLERSMAGELHHTPEGQLIHTVVAAANQPVHRLDIEARSKSMATAARKTNNGTWQQATKKIATAARAIAANAAR